MIKIKIEGIKIMNNLEVTFFNDGGCTINPSRLPVGDLFVTLPEDERDPAGFFRVQALALERLLSSSQTDAFNADAAQKFLEKDVVVLPGESKHLRTKKFCIAAHDSEKMTTIFSLFKDSQLCRKEESLIRNYATNLYSTAASVQRKIEEARAAKRSPSEVKTSLDTKKTLGERTISCAAILVFGVVSTPFLAAYLLVDSTYRTACAAKLAFDLLGDWVAGSQQRPPTVKCN
ncbi:hypothetical protein JYU14_03810, partial [Simkania negevensis]|nr:hypothetical protein [Simkania negevensis]